jgi:hypothetical protein
MSNAPKRTKPAQPPRRTTKARPAAVSGIKFSLFVSGLCSFVPYTAAGISRMKVVLPNTEISMPGMEDPIHTAVFLVAAARIANSSRQPDFYFNGIKNGYRDTNMAGFLVRNQDLIIKELVTTAPILLTSGAIDCPPSTAPFPFDWIQGMPAGSDKMTETAFQKPAPDKVMARLDLYDGSLSTTRFPADFTGTKTLKWYLDKVLGGTPTGTPRAIAEEIKFFRNWPSGTAVTMTSLPAGLPDIILQPNSMTGILEAWVANLPLIDILINRSEGAVKDRGPEYHFMHFHDLATTPGNLIPWPHKTDKCNGNPTGDAANPRCPPVLFSGYVPGT